MIVGDVANYLLGGIPGDVHDMFIVDVEPEDLAKASTTLRDMSVGVRTLHVKLSGKVASFEGGWQGSGKDVFDSELWQPLSHGLGVLERECDYAADQFASLAVRAAEAHAEKVAALNQEIETQLWVIGAMTVVGSPEVGGVISKAVVGLATRLGGETVGAIVAGIVKAIETLIEKVVAALGKVIEWSARPLPDDLVEMGAKVKGLFGRSVSTDVSATTLGSTGRTEAATLREKLAMDQAMSRPSSGTVLNGISMRDVRWPASRGWVKMTQNVNGIEIHYVYNPTTGMADDFKFK